MALQTTCLVQEVIQARERKRRVGETRERGVSRPEQGNNGEKESGAVIAKTVYVECVSKHSDGDSD